MFDHLYIQSRQLLTWRLRKARDLKKFFCRNFTVWIILQQKISNLWLDGVILCSASRRLSISLINTPYIKAFIQHSKRGPIFDKVEQPYCCAFVYPWVLQTSLEFFKKLTNAIKSNELKVCNLTAR